MKKTGVLCLFGLFALAGCAGDHDTSSDVAGPTVSVQCQDATGSGNAYVVTVDCGDRTVDNSTRPKEAK